MNLFSLALSDSHARTKTVAAGRQLLWREWIKPLGLVAIIVFPLKSAVADWNWVPSGSMKPTILEGDLVFVNKLAYDLKVPFTLQRLAEWDNPGARRHRRFLLTARRHAAREASCCGPGRHD